MGRVRSISDAIPYGNTTSGQKYRRKIDIENLDGVVIEFTLWDDVSLQFKKDKVEEQQFPIIIAVSACSVSKYRGALQLSANSATHYYINPKCPEAREAFNLFKEKYNDVPPVHVTNYRYQETEKEKSRNRETLETLLKQNPSTFKGIRFSVKATITGFNTQGGWAYNSCRSCRKTSRLVGRTYVCEDHNKRIPTFYRYRFKATVADGTATAEFTFFTDAGQKLTNAECTDLVNNLGATSKIHFPTELTNTIDKMHIFQVEFAEDSQQGSGRFVVNDILDIQPLAKTTFAVAGPSVTLNDAHDEVMPTEASQLTSITSMNDSMQDTQTEGTPSEDIIDVIAQTIVDTIPFKAKDARPHSSKRSLAKDLASVTKKKKGD